MGIGFDFGELNKVFLFLFLFFLGGGQVMECVLILQYQNSSRRQTRRGE